MEWEESDLREPPAPFCGLLETDLPRISQKLMTLGVKRVSLAWGASPFLALMPWENL
jgi:hypothetical protein